MQKGNVPTNLISLTSKQIGDVIAKGFWGLLDSSRKLYRDDLGIDANLLRISSENDNVGQKISQASVGKYNRLETGEAPEMRKKGRVPIRSQTGHDHDRNHQKN